jgi:hypothetical protein
MALEFPQIAAALLCLEPIDWSKKSMPIPSESEAEVNRRRRLLLASAAFLPLASLNTDSLAGATLSWEVVNASIHKIYSVDEALRVPPIAALFDECKQPILQLDYADFEAVTRPFRANTDSQMWALSVALPTNADHSNTHIQSLQNALKATIASEYDILNVLAVFSCNPQVSAVSQLRRYQPLLASVVQPDGLYGLGVVADESELTPRMTLLLVTQPKT